MENNAVRFWKVLFTLTDQMKDRMISLKHISKEWNITIQQLRLLRIVDRKMRNGFPDGVMLKTLAEELNVTSATVSGMVETLVRRDILSRTLSPEDRRSVRITLSKSCIEKLQQVESLFSDISVYLTPVLGEEKMLELTGQLEQLSKDFDDRVPGLDELLRLKKQKAHI